ncbi:hypothetical protein GGE66_000339 [Rhizobium leguminosarum]|uniref:Uncharacterized protein n=1 Tax=Rhizobium leguminosarum TaxID=384 RepID=A0A7W9ZMH3_RHILE|nr:hypothetical protein [Rhizobium leguminosarum]MBB6219395.1 hypothetical protein [Rhizobium leguminosarum]
MSMTKQDISSRHFQRKISHFCELRIAPIASKRVLENVRPFLISLIIYRKPPPILNGRIDWTTIGQACGIETELTAELKKELRPGLDAITRWLGASPAEDVQWMCSYRFNGSFSCQCIRLMSSISRLTGKRTANVPSL